MSDGVPALLERIRGEIRERGPMTFARFMELALYDPDHGYYASRDDRLGTGGDFFTASDVGHAFGRCMARQLQEIDGVLGPLDPFHILEYGAGRGLLARDILDGAAALDESFRARLRYVMIERSPALQAVARATTPEAEVVDDPPATGQRGAVVAVELFDALPVHRVRRRDGKLVEVHVDLADDGSLRERELSPGTHVAALAERYGAAAEEGTEAEVCPRASVQLDTMNRAFDRGIFLVIDYGYTASDLYGPARPRGTLLAYHRNTTNEDYLARVGEQDLTAHVNFTQLEDRARELGLTVLGRTTQDRFLIGNGILEYFEAKTEEEYRAPDRVKQRLQAKQLIHPSGMGRAFHVLILAKGTTTPPDLSGLRDPFRAPD